LPTARDALPISVPAPDDVVGILVALMVAVGLGAFHALTPGHGKTVMAAYLVGTRGSHAQALILALAVALSHTAGVLALAVLTLAGSAILAPERAYPYLSAMSGARGLAERRLSGHRRLGRALRFAPSLSAIIVLILGLGMTAQSLAALL